MPDAAPAQPAMDFAIVNARIWTGDPRRPWADAVAVRDDRIAALGSSAAVKKMMAPGTRVVDARGGTVVPGSAESHPEFQGRAPGVLARGMPADLVLLDRDLPRVSAETIRDARVLLVVVGGRVAHETPIPEDP